MSKKHVFGILATSMVVATAISGAATSASAAPNTPAITVAPGVTATFTENYNPFLPIGDGTIDGTDGNIYETLFYFDSSTSKQFDLLGKGFTFSNGNKTITVNLRTNATWTDGKPFTAKDVVFTFDLLKKYPDADINGVWQQLASVKPEGNYKVVFNFKSVNVPYAEQYVLGGTYVVPQHAWPAGDPAKAKITLKQAIGTGPFIAESFNPQDYKFKANPHYYLGAPKVSELNYPGYASNSSADFALASGKIQYAGLNIPNVQSVYDNKSQYNHHVFSSSGVGELYPNLKNPLLAQLPVREAISDVINRSVLSKIGESGYEQPTNPTSLVLPGFTSWLDPKLLASDKTFTNSTSAAAKVLAQAGYKKDSHGIYAKNGKELSFNLLTVTGWSDWDEDATLMAQELNAFGIKINVEQQQQSAYTVTVSPSKGKDPNFDLAMSYTDVGPSPFKTYYDMLDSNGQWNLEGLTNATVDHALNAFASTSSLSQQKLDLYTVERYVATQLPVIPLLNGALWYEYNDSTYTGWPTKSNLWIDPSPYSYQSAAIVLQHLKPTK